MKNIWGKIFKIIALAFVVVVVLVAGMYFSGMIDIQNSIWEDTSKYHPTSKNSRKLVIDYLQGRKVDLSKSENEKLFLVNFWEPGCPGCIHEIQYLNKINKKYKDSIALLSFSQRDSGYVADYLTHREMRLEYRNIPSTVGLRTKIKKIAVMYGFEVDTITDFVPFSALIDRDGKVIKVYTVMTSDTL